MKEKNLGNKETSLNFKQIPKKTSNLYNEVSSRSFLTYYYFNNKKGKWKNE